jgi:hypothetical protein
MVERIVVRHGSHRPEPPRPGQDFGEDRRDPALPRLGKVVADHARVGVERQQRLAEVERLLRRAAEAAHQPIDRERSGPRLRAALVVAPTQDVAHLRLQGLLEDLPHGQLEQLGPRIAVRHALLQQRL